MDFRKSFRWESRRSEPVVLLKEYLKDDLSSCSSGGFNSLPRRPSCSSSSLSASVRFLIDIDLRSEVPTPDKGLSRSLSSSLFRSAAVKIVNAVKLPLRMTCFLLLSGSQTKKFSRNREEEDTRRWSFFGDEDDITWSKDAASSILSCGSDSNRVDWDRNVMVSGRKDATVVGGEIVNGTDGENGIGPGSTGPSSKELFKGNLQFSPVSMLDCYEDHQLTTEAQSKQSPGNINTRGGKHGHDGLSRLAQAELEKQITLPELEEEATRLVEEEEEEEEEEMEEQEGEAKDNAEAVLERMLKTMKVDVPSDDSKSDVLLLDFFREKLVEWEEYRYTGLQGWDSFEDEVVHTAEEWMCGKPKEAYVGWEIEGQRMAYIKDMQRGGDLAGHEVCLEVDNVVWTLLVYETLIDIFG